MAHDPRFRLFTRFPFSLAACLLVALASCSAPRGSREAEPGPVETDAPARTPTLLVPVYFYHGSSVGAANKTSGLHASTDRGAHWRAITWPELISNSVSVDASGRWLYLACGNGVMVSRDAGQRWWLTGGWEMTEVQRVAISRRDPRIAFAATAYGLFVTADSTRGEWTPRDSGGKFRYLTDVREDAGDPAVLWVVGDRGVFVSRDAGAHFEASLAGVKTRRLHQDPTAPKRLWAATDGHGLMHTRDGGRTWRRVPGPPDATFCVIQHPHEPHRLLVGTMQGLYEEGDGGAWTCSASGLPKGYSIYGVTTDPEDPERILVAGNNGVFGREGRGASWQRLGFADALIQDLAAANVARVPRAKLPDEDAPGVDDPDAWRHWFQPQAWKETDPDFETRRREILRGFESPPDPDHPWPGYLRAIPRVRSGQADERFWEALRARLEMPGHSMFFSLELMAFYAHCRDRLPEDVRERIRVVLTETPIYRGDTENHWVMHYTVALLAAETWPETPASRWYTGRSTRALEAEARGWLEHWARLTATRGQGEFDSPNYMYMYVAPMALLYHAARDPGMKQLAGMMLDLLLADYFVESLHGAYCGGHSRIIGKEVELTVNNRVSALHYLYAGGIPRPEKIHPWALHAALSSYRPPAVFAAIANRRETPYVHTEVKRVRNVMRFGRELNPPVHKTDFMTPDYGLGSLQGGILQPIQQHTWDVTWLGSAENATLFTVHPAVSNRELGMFFPEDVRDIIRIITRQKNVYASPDKWISASAFEQVFQRENVLLALYQVPEGERFPHVDLYWPKCLERREEGGWWFGRDGEFFLACFAGQPGAWTEEEDHWRFRSPAGRAGFVVIVRPYGGDFVKPITSDAFRKAILAGPRPTLAGEGSDLSLTYTSPDRIEYRKVWGEPTGRMGGKPVPFPSDWLFRGPFITSRAGSKVITLTDGKIRRALDFDSFTVTEAK